MAGPRSPRALDRRGFLQLLAGAIGSLPAVAAAAPPPPAPTTPTPAPASTAPPHSGNEARLLTEVLRSRYPDRFAEAQWGTVVTDFDGDLGTGRRLRAVKLANADEPDFAFRA
jgi:hypothetical protein